VQITLEDTSTAEPANFPTGRHSVYLATTTQDSAWETLTFTFDNRPDAAVPDTIVTRIVLLFNPNTNTDGTYFFDNLIGPEFAVDPCAGATSSDSLLTDFECEQDAFVTFNHGASLRRVPNPDQSGINTSDFMASYIRNPGEEFDVIVGGFSQPIVFGDTNAFRIHVWDGNAPTGVRLAIQYRDDAGNTLLDISDSVSTTAASQWEELTFRFGDLSDTTVNTFVLLFDPGDFTNDTYFWDNMTLVSDANLVNIEDYLENGNVQVFPNPSQGLTQFQYDLRQAGEVSISIHDISGRLVDEIRPGFQGAGPQQLSWENRSLEAGMYFYTFQVNEQITGGKIVISR
ncbi:MAG: T9SS type A sorting domain-containing protein, partial [Bacteroidota bacterium]